MDAFLAEPLCVYKTSPKLNCLANSTCPSFPSRVETGQAPRRGESEATGELHHISSAPLPNGAGVGVIVGSLLPGHKLAKHVVSKKAGGGLRSPRRGTLAPLENFALLVSGNLSCELKDSDGTCRKRPFVLLIWRSLAFSLLSGSKGGPGATPF